MKKYDYCYKRLISIKIFWIFLIHYETNILSLFMIVM